MTAPDPRATSETAPLVIGNEFAEVLVDTVTTRNGVRLRIRSRRSGRAVSLCPLELESLTWQGPELFSQLLARVDHGEADDGEELGAGSAPPGGLPPEA